MNIYLSTYWTAVVSSTVRLEPHNLSINIPIINPRRACAARVTVVVVCVCLSVKSHLTYGVSVPPENAVTYSAGNEGKKICGVFSENAPLLRSSGVPVVFHTFRWPFFFIAKVVRMRIGIHSYALAEPQGNTQLAQRLSATFSLAQNDAASPSPRVNYSYNTRRGQFPRTHIGIVRRSSMRRGFCTLVLFIY